MRRREGGEEGGKEGGSNLGGEGGTLLLSLRSPHRAWTARPGATFSMATAFFPQ